ncbi:serine hydrolase [Virgibacillus dakarensis]|nr:beta-lactamase family protein [Virgibacillus dakarensis]MTW88351.1 serine hydrolase [Virgibacillus dakarensis]
MNEDLIKNFERKIKKDKIDSCLVHHRKSVVFEYFRNRKMKERQHKIYSVTKSILSILIGIAINKGYIEHVNTPIIHYFPEFKKDTADQKITIKHLLTMTSGLHWPGNNAMIPSKNWVEFILDQPVDYPPGQRMIYSCGSSHLLSSILQKATGLNTEAFAKKHLFIPLGITNYRWNFDAQGVAIAGFGLNMMTVDLLKIGVLYMDKGRWNSNQIVPSHWVEESTSAKFKVNDSSAYGYHWWINKQQGNEPRFFLASGFKGQYILVVPDYQLVVIYTSNIVDDASRPIHYFKDYLLPSAINK